MCTAAASFQPPAPIPPRAHHAGCMGSRPLHQAAAIALLSLLAWRCRGQVHEHLRGKLCDLYENDSIFDKFECCMSGSGDAVATGSYNHLFRLFATDGRSDATLEARPAPRPPAAPPPSLPPRPRGRACR